MESGERTQYANSILVAQAPMDATEIVRVRLSQAKLLNDEFSKFFKNYYTVKSNYLSELTKLVKQSQDLNKNIEQSIIEHQVLSRDEMKYYNIDAIGDLSRIWERIITEIKDEISANSSLKNVVEREVIHPLNMYTNKNQGWSQIRELHAKLSEVAQTIEFNQDKVEKHKKDNHSKHHPDKLAKLAKYETGLQSAKAAWATEAPYVFEVFENTDLARLNFLRDSLLKFITAYTDALNEISQSNEKTLESILNFNPETEITRFAKVSSETDYIPKETRKAAESPETEKSHGLSASASNSNNHQHNHLSPIFSKPQTTSAGTAISKPDIKAYKPEKANKLGKFAKSENTDKLDKPEKAKKERTKLRSKVGTLFGKKKKDKKKPAPPETIAESDVSSLTERTTSNNRMSRASSFISGAALNRTASTRRPKSHTEDVIGKYNSSRGDLSVPKEEQNTTFPSSKNSPTAFKPPSGASVQDVPMSLNQPPLMPSKGVGGGGGGGGSSSNLNGGGSTTSVHLQPPQRKTSDISYTDQVSQINMGSPTSEPFSSKFQQETALSSQSQSSLGIGIGFGAGIGAGIGTDHPQSLAPPPISTLAPHAIGSVSNSSLNSPVSNQAPPPPPPLSASSLDQAQPPPPPPPSRKVHAFSGTQSLSNIREDGDFSVAGSNSGSTAMPLSENTPAPPVSRRDIQSMFFTNLSQSDLESQNKRMSSLNSFTNSMSSQLHPQATGSSLLSGAGLFNHPKLTSPGLSASIAEIINAKFKDGEQISSQVLGEIAFNYQQDPSSPLNNSFKTNLKVTGIEDFDKVIPNSQFLKQIDKDEFELLPKPISSRTLGGLKYSVKNVTAPLVILPAWRFEPHQASVMLTIKLHPEIATSLEETDFIHFDNLAVSVSIQGTSSSALSKPLGTFNREKSRITWRFNEPVKLGKSNEQKLVARFMTETEAKENEQGVLVKFSVGNDGNSKFVTSAIDLKTENILEDDPFALESWTPVPILKELVSGHYSGT